MMKHLYSLPSRQDISLYNQMVQKFTYDSTEDVFFDKLIVAWIKDRSTVFDVLEIIKAELSEGWVTMPQEASTAVITGKRNGHPVFIWMTIKEYSEAVRFKIDIHGTKNNVTELHKQLRLKLDNQKLSLIKWWFLGRHGEEVRDFYLPQDNLVIRPEYYPDMSDPHRFLADYMASNESILLLAGPPGTGKTTLLRHMITEYKMCAHIIYDESLMSRDGPFQNFMFGDTDYRPSDDEEGTDPQKDIMIIEDADTILASRERDSNKLMARFLNISDGLIKLPNKKLVFTTNLSDFDTSIDPALIRPGRCYGVVKMRELDLTEAQAAARVAGVPIPFEKRTYPLAEIFKSKTSRVRKVGFV